MNMKSYNILYIMISLLFVTGCSDDDFFGGNSLTPEQEALIGRAVNFDASIAEQFTTRTSWIHDGSFNDNDQMTIYRQYWNAAANEGKGEWGETAYRVYTYDPKYATGTTISLGINWKVQKGKTGANWNSTLNEGKGGFSTITQTDKDSLTWENGKPLRFRAWSRSNLAGVLTNGTAERYYPDFCIADWVTMSGPTNAIPLVLKHVTTRIGFTCKEGNEFAGAEICLNEADYRWDDNSDSHDNDEADKHTSNPKPDNWDTAHPGETWTPDENSSEWCAAEVNAVYNRMCMPGGVNIDDGTLLGMSKTKYANLTTSNGFANIENHANDMIQFGKKTPDEITSLVERPKFSYVDGRMYMLTIPYDMSSASTMGDILVLPACTRFKIKLRDVNNGDAANTSGYEAKEHIFSLSDIKVDGESKYKDGLILTPGKSYLFSVGYQYDKLKVDIIEEGMDWTQGDAVSGDGNANTITESSVSKYNWWKTAISTAIKEARENGKDYNPVFHISTLEEFHEFIKLVNGTAYDTSLPSLKRADRSKCENPNNPDMVSDELATDKEKTLWWYRECDIQDGDTVWMTHERANSLGYIFYRQYYPQVSDKSAYSEETYLQKPFSFYDERVNLHFVVQLTEDIDMGDLALPSVGIDDTHPFKGFFDGGCHTLSNVNISSANMQGGYLFNYLEDGEIRDLNIRSTHPTGLLNVGRTSSKNQSVRIVGISLKADSPAGQSPIVNNLMLNDAQTNRGNAYVVGCIHEGKAGAALVGQARNLSMYACMYTAENRSGAALIGSHPDDWSPSAQPSAKIPTWGNFMCNYYLKEPKGTTNANKAVADKTDNYHILQYIRGSKALTLKARLDNLLGDDVPFNTLKPDLQEAFYGIAPWKAMNHAINEYNKTVATMHEYKTHPEDHQCKMKYSVSSVGYEHLYPQLVEGAITATEMKNPLKQNN